MVNPRTVNAGIIVPLTGADVDLWGEVDVNPNMVAIDGFIGGVQQVAVTGGNLTLSAPAGFTATPGPGPTQSQNRVLRFTGALTANEVVTLPLPGVYVIENYTTGNFVLSFRGATATEVIGTPQGDRVTIYNDGANVRFVDLGKVGTLEFWAGLSAMPAWVAACTVPPYLLCDGTASYTFAQLPYLGARMGSAFGGNGVTTFGVPDLRGRYPLSYDGTGSRVTAGISGLNGQSMGAVLDAQGVALTVAQLASHYHQAGIYDPKHSHTITGQSQLIVAGSGSGVGGGGAFGVSGSPLLNTLEFTNIQVTSPNGNGTTYSAGSGNYHNNMPNTQVAGIWVIKT